MGQIANQIVFEKIAEIKNNIKKKNDKKKEQKKTEKYKK